MADETYRQDDEMPETLPAEAAPALDPLPDLSPAPETIVEPVPVVEAAPASVAVAAPPSPTPVSVQPARRRGLGGFATFLIALSSALIGAALGTLILLNILGIGPMHLADWLDSMPSQDVVEQPVGAPTTPPASQPRTDLETAEQVAEKVVPSVVNVSIQTSVFNPMTGQQQNQMAGNGSGVIIDSQGHILTNAHVVAGGSDFLVTVGNRDYPAEVVGTDPSSDVAVLKIEATGLVPIELGDSGAVKVGQWVMAVGSPFGLEKSVSTGIVSALKRSETMAMETGSSVYSNMIQVDAAINPGNSGGALVDAQGRLIGMPTLIQSTSGQSAGVGFAIPANYAMEIASQLIQTGTAVHPFLGVSVQTVDAAVASQYGLSVNKGAYIASVQEDSAALEAGIEIGDVVIEIAGERIDTADDLLVEIRAHRPGDQIDVVLVRNGEELTVRPILGRDLR